jgi:hypothetical protein
MDKRIMLKIKNSNFVSIARTLESASKPRDVCEYPGVKEGNFSMTSKFAQG